LGSFFAGIKAGTLSGMLYVGGLAIFNVVLLYALKGDVLRAIQSSYSSVCAPTAIGNGTVSIEDCFSSVVSVDVPYVAFVAFFISLLYAGIFGRVYDSLPGTSPVLRGELIATIVGANLLFFGFAGFYFDFESEVATSVFLLIWSIVFGYFLGRLYKKYTRVVQFSADNPDLLKVMVDGSNQTGKSRTFALTSSHRVRAEVAEDASFREWKPSGGISVEDPRSFETLFEVNGDGVLKGQASKKY
jgi:hypothetical protein